MSCEFVSLWVCEFVGLCVYEFELVNMWVCLFLAKKINIMSAIVIHQTPTLPQKIDSREGWFGYKRGLDVYSAKMNAHCIKPQFTPKFGLLGAKNSAFRC